MRKLIEVEGKFVVYDGVLPAATHEEILRHFGEASFLDAQYQQWNKVWRVTDGSPITTTTLYHSQLPSRTPLDAFAVTVLNVCEKHKGIVGSFGKDWKDIAFSYYLYRRGTKINWHGDAENYAGAVTYYAHGHWSPTWGGELMVPICPDEFPPPAKPISPAIDHQYEDRYLSVLGMGHYVQPKPNRLVLLKGGVMHAVNRVDDDAGDNLRMTVQAFLLRERAKIE